MASSNADSARRIGRPPTTMTDEVCDRIAKMVSVGIPAEVAAQAANVPPPQMRAHRKRNAMFASALKTAEAKAEQSITLKLVAHAGKNWMAAMAYLSRRVPERWGRWREDVRPESVRPRSDAASVLELPPNATPAMQAAHDRLLAAFNDFQCEQARATSGYVRNRGEGEDFAEAAGEATEPPC